MPGPIATISAAISHFVTSPLHIHAPSNDPIREVFDNMQPHDKQELREQILTEAAKVRRYVDNPSAGSLRERRSLIRAVFQRMGFEKKDVLMLLRSMEEDPQLSLSRKAEIQPAIEEFKSRLDTYLRIDTLGHASNDSLLFNVWRCLSEETITAVHRALRGERSESGPTPFMTTSPSASASPTPAPIPAPPAPPVANDAAYGRH